MAYKWEKEDFIEAVATSESIRQILIKLDLKPAGGNYITVKEKIREFGLDDSHLKGKGWSKGSKVGPKRDIASYLVKGKRCSSNTLRKRLISEGLKKAECEVCRLEEWNNLPIPLELDHIDGDKYNNLLSNLRILCPNCHAQTDTYRGKNIGKAVR